MTDKSSSISGEEIAAMLQAIAAIVGKNPDKVLKLTRAIRGTDKADKREKTF